MSGFSDGESTFFIKLEPSGKTGKKIAFVYKIALHIDDICTLKIIQSNLSLLAGTPVGNLLTSKFSATLAFTNFKILRALIIPIFNAYPLRSAKYFDFKTWEEAINIKSQAKILKKGSSLNGPSYSLSSEEINKIIKLKDSMNSNRQFIDESLLPQGELNPYWVLGFCEGESSFSTQPNRNFSPRFSITQHKKSLIVLKAINKFIYNLPFQIPHNIILTDKALEIVKLKSKQLLLHKDSLGIYNPVTRPTENQLLVSSQVLIFFHLLPFFENLMFISRKGSDFLLWSINFKLKLAGYHKTEEGKVLMSRIADNINNSRYSNYHLYNKSIKNKALGKIKTTLPTEVEINNLITKIKTETGYSIISPFNVFNHSK